MARAGTHEDKEEVMTGRRGCRVSGEAGILSWWACTLHGVATAGKGHGSGATQWDVRGEDGRAEPVPLQGRGWRGVERKEGFRDSQRQSNSK